MAVLFWKVRYACQRLEPCAPDTLTKSLFQEDAEKLSSSVIAEGMKDMDVRQRPGKDSGAPMHVMNILMQHIQQVRAAAAQCTAMFP